MDGLKAACWFQREREAPREVARVDVRALESFVTRGRAALLPCVLSTAQQVVSVSVKDASQGDVAGLPCGARSLLIEEATGAIVCRGINKFFDVSDVRDDWAADASLWGSGDYRVWAVRKMAGFVITVFSLDGVQLDVMSKHVLAGPHVDCARRLLARVDGARRAAMARELFEWSACACFECISGDEDSQHPVMEADVFSQQLVLFAVQKRAQLREESLSVTELPTVAARWGVMAAPAAELKDGAALSSVFAAAAAWKGTYAPFVVCPVLAEGFVLLIEAREGGADAGGELPWRFPLRLKLKTPRYVVLRALRSLVQGDSAPQSCLYHQALLGWLQPMTAAEVRARLAGSGGVHRLNADFEASLLAKGRLRYRDAQESVGDALSGLQEVTCRTANPRSHCPLTVVVLSGLPGAGKTTVSKAVIQRLSQGIADGGLSFLLHLNRDCVSRDAALKHGITESSSKHKQRRLRALVHQELCAHMREVATLCVETQQRGLLLYDACNATEASRQVWRRCFPASLDGYCVAHVDCGDASVSASRAGHREHHEVLRSAAEAQQALYTVRKKFQPPTAAEAAWYVNTSTQSVEEAAAAVCEHVAEHLRTNHRSDAVSSRTVQRAGPPRVLTMAAVQGELSTRHAALLYSLLGLSAEAAGRLADVGAFLATQPAVRARSLRLRLRCSATTLWEVAASAVSGSLGVTAAPADTLLSAGRRLVRQVASALWGGVAAAPGAAVVLRGHERWLRGWLLHGKTVAAVSEVTAALAERFETTPATPHVTLLHPGTASGGAAGELSDDAIARYLSKAGLHQGKEVRVRVRSLLVDRHALCLGVTLANCETRQGIAEQGSQAEKDGEERTPLHITVGTAAGVPAAYAGAMFAAFREWQRENEALAEERLRPQPTVNRSQRKFHNFVEYALGTEVELTGVVEVHAEGGGGSHVRSDE